MSNQKHLVSIGMPVYNKRQYICQALDSLLSQTFGDFELIISDNASTDGTSEICQEYLKKDKRIKYIRQEENIGATRNFNFLLKQANGRYFMWASGDDLWDKNFLESCVKKLEENRKAVLAFTGVIGIDEEGKPIRFFHPQKFFPRESDIYLRLREYLLFYHHDGKANLIFGLWRRKKISDNELKDHWAADVGYVFRNLIKGKFILIDDFLFFKRMRIPKRGVFSKIYRETGKRILAIFSLYLRSYFPAILKSKNLNLKNKFKLIMCILSTIPRLFVKRYI